MSRYSLTTSVDVEVDVDLDELDIDDIINYLEDKGYVVMPSNFKAPALTSSPRELVNEIDRIAFSQNTQVFWQEFFEELTRLSVMQLTSKV